MRRPFSAIAGLTLLLLRPLTPAMADEPAPAAAKATEGLAIYDDPKYKPGFTHFDYVNPDAPKGGTLRMAEIGTFDNLNPFIVKGIAPGQIGSIFDTLMVSSADEPFSMYGLLAQSVEVAPDRSWVIFNLRPEARFNDAAHSPVTADDVIFSFNTLRDHGQPLYRFYYHNVAKVEKLGPLSVRFDFSNNQSRELPLILGQLPVLSAKDWQGKDFEQTTLTTPLGSGPYQVKSFDAGRDLVLQRVTDYWGKDVPEEKGFNNYDTIRVDYYGDSTVALQAFKAGAYDLRQENTAQNWATAYDFPAVKDGRVVKGTFANKRPTGMQAFAFNLRRPQFQDPRVREALIDAYDFEWENKNLFYGQYARTGSYFSNSDLASSGLPGPDELKLLEPLRGQIPDEVFTKPYTLPVTDGSGNDRDNLLAAAALLKQAGWTITGGQLVDSSGKPFPLEFLVNVDEPAITRIILPFVQNLARLGIKASVRQVDSSQYENRVHAFDFDMVLQVWPESESPGNEQREFWSSATADEQGSQNVAGVRSKAIDTLVDDLIAAQDRAALVAACKALDRVLLWSDVAIPTYHAHEDHYAYWNKFGMPATIPDQGVDPMTWWIDPAKDAALAGHQGS